MMTPESVRRVLDEVKNWTAAEWTQFAARVENKYALRKDDVVLLEEDVVSAMRLIAMENEWPYEKTSAKQTTMGF